MEECRLQREIAQWRGAERITVIRVSSDLLQPEILVGVWPIKRDVAGCRCDLRYCSNVLSEIAEHFIRLSGDGVTTDAVGRSKEQHRAALLILCHRVL